MAKVFLNQGQGQINSSGYSGRSEDVAVANEDGIGLDGDGRITSEQRCHRPVRRRPSPIQQSRLCQEEGAAAHRSQSPHPRSSSSQPVEKSRVAHSLLRLAAGYDQRVDLGCHRVVGPLRQDRQTRAASNRPSLARQHLQPVRRRCRRVRLRPAPIRHRENLQRSSQVERLDAVVNNEGNVARGASGHGGNPMPDRICPQ